MRYNSIKYFWLNHWPVILVAVVVAFVAGLPQVVVRHTLGPEDHGVPYLINDSEGEYLARVHEILDGHLSVASPTLYEYKDAIVLMPPTGEFIFYALPVMVTGISLSTVIFLSKFLYPALLFFLAYLFIFSLLNRNDRGAKLSAIAGALLIVVGYDAYDYRNLVSYVLYGTADSAGLLWNRLVNPITGAMLLFAFLGLFSRIVKGQGRWLTIIISGLVLAAMSGYIFSFALGLTIPVLMGLYFIWRKNWSMVWRVYIPIVIAVLINGLYLVKAISAIHGEAFISDARKSGMFLTHVPLINLISLASLIGVVLCFIIFFKKDTALEPEKRWWFFSLATVGACELVYNQQIITGRAIWPQHFVQYTTPLSMAILAVFLHNILRTYAKNLWRIAMISLIVIVILFGWRGFEAATKNTIPKYTELQSFAGVFNYLNTNAPKDCVVYVMSDYRSYTINRFIPALTQCNNYHTYYLYSGVPNERIMHNYLVNLRLRGIKPADVKVHFFNQEDWFFTTSYFFRDWNDMLCCGDPWLKKFGDKNDINRWFTSVEKDVEQKYAEYLKGDLYSELTKYRLDYFVVDTKKQPQVNEKRYPFLSLKGTFGQFNVYAVTKPHSTP